MPSASSTIVTAHPRGPRARVAAQPVRPSPAPPHSRPGHFRRRPSAHTRLITSQNGQARLHRRPDVTPERRARGDSCPRRGRGESVPRAGISAKLADRARLLAAAYVEGANLALARSTPWELRMLGYRPEPWSIEDTILLARMTGRLRRQRMGELSGRRSVGSALLAPVLLRHGELEGRPLQAADADVRQFSVIIQGRTT